MYKIKEIDYQPISKAQKLLMKKDFENVYDVCLFGASGGGKTVAILISSLGPQKDRSFLVDRPEYRALFLRRESTLLQRSGLLDAAYTWYRRFYPTVEFNKVEKTFTFPSGAKIFFGGVEQDSDKEKYKGYTELHCVLFEELTQFSQTIYDFICSRLRTKTNIPLRVRSTTNPGDKEEEWVMDRYKYWITKSVVSLDKDISTDWGETLYYWADFDGRKVGKEPKDSIYFSFCGIETFADDITTTNSKFMSAQINDPALKAQLVDGIWGIKPTAGMYFKEDDFIPGERKEGIKIRYWDKACSGQKGDFLAGALVTHYLDKELKFHIEDLILVKPEVSEVQKIIQKTALMDGKNVWIGIEQEGASAGKEISYIYKESLEKLGYKVLIDHKHGMSKQERASLVSPLSTAKKITYTPCSASKEMFNQLVNFPTKNVADDAVDSITGAIFLLQSKLPKPTNILPVKKEFNLALLEEIRGTPSIFR